MKAVINAEKRRYAEKFVLPAIAPEAIVTAVAAKTTWKKKSVAPDRPSVISKSDDPDRKYEFPPINHPPP